jgi:hypothetical protein
VIKAIKSQFISLEILTESNKLPDSTVERILV